MPRHLRATTLLAGLLFVATAAATEAPQSPVRRTVAELVRNPAPDSSKAPGLKPAGRQATAARKTPLSPSKSPLPMLDEKNLGLGCAQG